MATLEHIHFSPWREFSADASFSWEPDPIGRKLTSLPQIFWEDGEGWAEVNLWALSKAINPECNIETVKSLMKHLFDYAKYLESNNLNWRHFPARLSERAIVRFRGDLIKRIQAGTVSSNTARSRINAITQFYRYSSAQGLFSPENPLWQEKQRIVRFHDTTGFSRAISRISTDLSIPNRTIQGIRLEDGLLPLSDGHMVELLNFTAREETPELHLMLTTGFFTGARLCTITTLRIENLESALPDPYIEDIFLIRVGPGTSVSTKFNVEGSILIPKKLLEELKKHSYSTSRLKREAKADRIDKSLVFLTSHGKPYNRNSIGVLMSSLRRKAIRANLKFMKSFKFHMTRATYGTWLMKLSLSVSSTGASIEFVKNAMLHKHEASTFTYVKFLENTEGKQQAAAAFNQAFTGIKRRIWDDFKT